MNGFDRGGGSLRFDTISVRSFGTKTTGDGITDDTATWQRCADHAALCSKPSRIDGGGGVYRVRGRVTFDGTGNDQNKQIIVDGGGSGTLVLADVPGDAMFLFQGWGKASVQNIDFACFNPAAATDCDGLLVFTTCINALVENVHVLSVHAASDLLRFVDSRPGLRNVEMRSSSGGAGALSTLANIGIYGWTGLAELRNVREIDVASLLCGYGNVSKGTSQNFIYIHNTGTAWPWTDVVAASGATGVLIEGCQLDEGINTFLVVDPGATAEYVPMLRMKDCGQLVGTTGRGISLKNVVQLEIDNYLYNNQNNGSVAIDLIGCGGGRITDFQLFQTPGPATDTCVIQGDANCGAFHLKDSFVPGVNLVFANPWLITGEDTDATTRVRWRLRQTTGAVPAHSLVKIDNANPKRVTVSPAGGAISLIAGIALDATLANGYTRNVEEQGQTVLVGSDGFNPIAVQANLTQSAFVGSWVQAFGAGNQVGTAWTAGGLGAPGAVLVEMYWSKEVAP